MKHPRLPRLALLASSCALALASGGAGAADTSTAGSVPARAIPKYNDQSVFVIGTRDPSTWLRAESPHFVVLTDTSSIEATRLLNQLERLDALLRLYTAPISKSAAGAAQKLSLYYLKNKSGFASFAPGAPTRAIGMFNSCAAGVLGVGVQVAPIAALSDAELAHYPLEEGQSYLFEAYARHFLFRNTDVRAPAAVIEGLAKYFSAVRFSGAQMVVGRTPTGVGRYFGMLDEGYEYQADYADVFAHTYVRDPELDVDPRKRTKQLEIEARAWILAHYMLSTEERRARMPGFLDAVHHGTLPAQAFEHSYGVKPGQMSNAMWRYRLSAKTLQVELAAMDPVPVAIRVLTRAAGEFVQAEALRASCPGEPEGKALLRSAAAQAADMQNSDVARAGIARLQVDWGDLDAVAQAEQTLRQAATHAPTDADAAYWLGRAGLRLAARDPARLAGAQADLARATRLRPAASEFALARLQAALTSRTGADRPALDAVIKAWRGARDNNALAREAVLAYAVTGDAAGASHVMQVLSNDSRDPDSQAWAADWRARLEKGVAPAALYTEMRRLAQAGPAVKEWTVDEDTVASDVERRKAIDNMRHVIPFVPPTGVPDDVNPYMGSR